LISKNLLFIGGGNMGAALAAGLIAARAVKPRQVRVTDVDKNRLSSLKRRLGVLTGTDNRAAAADADVLVLCVKPQQMPVVLAELKGALTPRQLTISIAAGVDTRTIEDGLGGKAPVVRTMPNTPALLQAGALVYCLGRFARPAHEKLARAVLAPAGRLWAAGESAMDAVTALSGSGPAYVFYLAECLARAGKDLGLKAELAEALARRTIYGAGLMLERTADSAAALRERVTSPGGTTAAALAVLRDRGLERIFQDALAAARKRSQELSGRPKA
jgi:pyrroline-5-carboxylate reductase